MSRTTESPLIRRAALGLERGNRTNRSRIFRERLRTRRWREPVGQPQEPAALLREHIVQPLQHGHRFRERAHHADAAVDGVVARARVSRDRSISTAFAGDALTTSTQLIS